MKINFRRLNHVQVCIPAGAENEARAFYGGVLGLREIAKPDALKMDGGVWYEIADAQIHVSVVPAPDQADRHAAFEVENLEDIIDYLAAQGVKTRRSRSLPDARRASFYDPFGNRFELMELISQS
jgi:catechol 2,3-dioxygenase-like lactoylglutathione lyase family enzyme